VAQRVRSKRHTTQEAAGASGSTIEVWRKRIKPHCSSDWVTSTVRDIAHTRPSDALLAARPQSTASYRPQVCPPRCRLRTAQPFHQSCRETPEASQARRFRARLDARRAISRL